MNEKEKKIRFNLYQINTWRDKLGVAFFSWGQAAKLQKSENLNWSIYEKTYSGTVKANNLNRLFEAFNRGHAEECEPPRSRFCRAMSVSDVIEVVEADGVNPGMYYCDALGFAPIITEGFGCPCVVQGICG